MADIGHQKTDDIIEELERKIRKQYEQANKEVQEKVDKYFARFSKKDEQKQAEVTAGTLSQKEYEKWRYRQMCVGERWKGLKDQLAQDYVNVNNIARSIAEGYAPEVYALNHNFAAYQVQHDANMDISWTLYNREAVEHLMEDDPQLLPFLGTHSPTAEKLRERADLIWNRQHVNSAITQGILQGESIPEIARRLQKVTDMNTSAAVRNARTMMTSVENKGRQDAYDRLKEKGVELQEMWMATLDSRTRHSHRHLHGTYKDPKTGEYANGLRYPADPMGDPEEVYNCRCCEIAEVEKVPVGAPEYSPKMGGMTFEEWLEGGSGHATFTVPRSTAVQTPKVTVAQYEQAMLKIQGITPQFARGMAEALEKCNFEKAQQLYLKYADQLVIKDGKLKKGAYFSPLYRGVFMNLKTVMSGDVCHRPYQTAFHEFGHMIDFLYSKRRPLFASNGDPNGRRNWEVQADGGVLYTLLKSDYNAFKKSIGAKSNAQVISFLRAEGMDKYTAGSLSDILEGMTRTSYPLGVGHGASYHKDKGNTEVEFFAEVLDGAVGNEDSYKQLERVFPNAVNHVWSLVEEMIK